MASDSNMDREMILADFQVRFFRFSKHLQSVKEVGGLDQAGCYVFAR